MQMHSDPIRAAAVVFIVAAALFFIIIIRKNAVFGICLLSVVLIGFISAAFKTDNLNSRYQYLKSLTSFEGYIIDRQSACYTVRNYKYHYNILVYGLNSNAIHPGDYIHFDGSVNNRPAYKIPFMNASGINAYVTYSHKNSTLTSTSSGSAAITKDSSLRMVPVKMKYRLVEALTKLDVQGGAFISGLLTGYTGDIDPNTKTAFMDLGLTHILAVSGFNLGILYLFVRMLTKNFNARLKYLTILIVCFAYTCFTGFEPSITRAFVMLFIAMTAKILNRYYDPVTGTVITAWGMLMTNCFLIFSYGFLLTFTATLGILLFTKEFEVRLPERITFGRSELAVCMSAFFSTLPIILWIKGSISILSLGVNLLVSPLVSVLTIAGFLSGLLFMISSIHFLLIPVVSAGMLFMKLVYALNTYNISVYPGDPGILFIFVYYTGFLLLFRLTPMPIPLSDVVEKRFRIFTLAIFAGIEIFLLFHHSPCLKLHFINVGQGESIFIETPEHRGILVDTGPTREDYSALKSIVLPYMRRLGYNSLDLLVLTHFHSDHAGDYPYLLDHIHVRNAIAFYNPPNVKYHFDTVKKGDSIKDGSLELQIMAPDENSFQNANNPDDLNETCLVLHLSYKNFSALLTGDATKEVMDGVSGNYDVFNVSHHGSIKSFSPSMLEKSNIGIAVISVGKNSFGHPSPILIQELREKHIPVYRTDVDGTITIETSGKNYTLLFQ